MSKRNAKIAITAAVVLLALGGQARLAHAGAIAQSILDIDDFTVTIVGGTVTGTIFVNTGSATATLNGVSDVEPPVVTTGDIDLRACVGGPCPPPGTEVNPPPTETFASSSAILSGSVLSVGGADALTDNTVSLETSGIGSATSNLGLNSSFTLTVAPGPLATVSFSDDVRVDLLAHLEAGQSGLAFASVSWTLTVAGPTSFVFAPNGIVDAALGETEDDCNQNTSRSVAGAGPLTAEINLGGECTGQFAATVNLLPGQYTVTIAHGGSATAQTIITQVPEPGSLSLAALALLAFGLGRRRFFKS